MNQVIAHAPAKINLALAVEPPVPGEEKHKVSSVFCTIALTDTMIFDFTVGAEPFNADIIIEGVDLDVSFIKRDDNTLTKTVEQFKREYGSDFLPPGTLRVQLIKSIPAQSGLGGGSSNAAAMLRMLCWLSQVDPLSERSLTVARAVGADVPFFLHAPKEGFCALMDGYGDQLSKALPKPLLHLALIKPTQGISSRKAYEAFDRAVAQHERTTLGSAERVAATDALEAALEAEADAARIAPLCLNSLEPAALQLLPPIASLKEEMNRQAGILGTSLTGSGSVLFALGENEEAARACMQHFADQGFWAVATCT